MFKILRMLVRQDRSRFFQLGDDEFIDFRPRGAENAIHFRIVGKYGYVAP